ncbi:large subunit terminase [Caudoviricetes sp.]|nr:large subunit terminase [Caudoviricetes sp.]
MATDVAARQIDFRLNAPQRRAFNALHNKRRRTVVLAWGRGVGKSYFVRQVWWKLVQEYEHRLRSDALKPFRGVRIIVLMPTLKQFKDVHLAGILAEISDEWAHLRGKVDQQSGQIGFPGGSWIKPFPASEYNSKTARGMRCDLICADECDDISREVYDSVAIPWLSEPWSLGLQINGGTPRRGRHGLLFRQYEAGRKGKRLRLGETVAGLRQEQIDKFPKIFSFHATYANAPENVSAEAAAEAKASSVPSVFAREWECDFDAGEGLVYGGAYDERFHVRQPSTNQVWSEYLIGCDHGYEDPGVFLLIGVMGSGRDAVSWVLEEIYEQHKTEDWWKDQLKKWIARHPGAKFYGDPSMPARLEAYRRDCRTKVQEVDNSIEDGVSLVADRFMIREQHDAEGRVTERNARLYVSPRCVNLIRELGVYKRRNDPRDPDRYTDDIVDRDNHANDALRYAIFNRFKDLRSYRAA